MPINLTSLLQNSYRKPQGLTAQQYNDTINRMSMLYNNMASDLYGGDFNKIQTDANLRKTFGSMGPQLDRFLSEFGKGPIHTVANYSPSGGPVYFDSQNNRWMAGKPRYATDQFGNLDSNILQGYDYSPNADIEAQFIKNAFSQLADPYTTANKQLTNPNDYVNSQLAKLFGSNTDLAGKYGVNLKNPITNGDPFAPTIWANGNAVSRAPDSLADMYVRANGATDGRTGMNSVWNSSQNGSMLNQNVLQALSGGTGRNDLTAARNLFSDMFGAMGFKDSALNDIVNNSLNATRYGLGIDTSDATQAPRWNMLQATLNNQPGGGGVQNFASWIQPTITPTTQTPTTPQVSTPTGNVGNNVNVGNTNTVDTSTSTQRPQYNFDPSQYPARTANQGFREGSRYFSESSNGYTNNYPGLGNLFQNTPPVL